MFLLEYANVKQSKEEGLYDFEHYKLCSWESLITFYTYQSLTEHLNPSNVVIFIVLEILFLS